MRISKRSLLCLSAAPNLRCELLTRFQSEVLLIPPAIELIFAVSLLVTKWRSGSRRHLLLAAEGWVYFFLALMDMLSHIVPEARNSLNLFTIFDIFIGTFSFLPLLLYTLFLFFLAKNKVIPNVPRQYQSITTYLLIIFIPVIAILNEIASFVGVSRRKIGGVFLAIGFRFAGGQTLWTFFTSVTLALLTLYQAIHFILSFYQLMLVFVDQRRIETSKSDEAHLLRGVGWVTAGLKLGAIESVIGFVSVGFGSILIRRILRLLGRACLVIGAVKGMDTAEDFRNLHDELGGSKSFAYESRTSKIKPLISNPRHSSFRRLSPSQIAFHETPRAPLSPLSPPQPLMSETDRTVSIATFGTPAPGPWSPSLPSPLEYQTIDYQPPKSIFSGGYQTPGYASSIATSTIRTAGTRSDRVTVNYADGQAPTLEMRFSVLDIPSPTALTEIAESRYPSGVSARLSTTSGFASVASPSVQNPPKAVSRPVSTRPRSTLDIGGSEKRRYKRSTLYSSRSRAMSSDSFASDSLDVVHNLTSQFPALPPRATGKLHGSVIADLDPVYRFSGNGVSRETSTKTYNSRSSLIGTIHTVTSMNSLVPRKPPPPIHQPDSTTTTTSRAASRNDSIRTEAGHAVLPDWRGDETAVSSPNTQASSSFGFGSRRLPSVETAATEDHKQFTNDDALLSSKSQTFNSSEYGGSRMSIRSAEWIATASRAKRTKAVDIEAYRNAVQQVSEDVSQPLPRASIARDGFEESQISTDSPEVSRSTNTIAAEPRGDVWSNELARIKSVGIAPRRKTPTPTLVAFPKSSVSLERHEVDTFMRGMEEVPRLDSGTFGYAV